MRQNINSNVNLVALKKFIYNIITSTEYTDEGKKLFEAKYEGNRLISGKVYDENGYVKKEFCTPTLFGAR